MPLYIEDAIDQLINDRKLRLQMTADDVKKLRSLRDASIMKSAGLTEKQRSLILKIINRYLVLLKMANFPIDDIVGTDGPNWRTALAPPISSTWRIKHDSDKFHVTFPYNPELINRLHSLQNIVIDNSTATWSGTQWVINTNFQGRNLIRTLLQLYNNWQCDVEVTQLLNSTDQYTNPKIRYLNGEWLIDTESESLRQVFNEKINPDNSELVTAFELGSLLVDFDFTVKNRLRSWLTQPQIHWLCDQSPTLTPEQLPNLISLVSTVNRWPILITGKQWRRSQIDNMFRQANMEHLSELFIDVSSYNSLEVEVMLTNLIASNSTKIVYSPLDLSATRNLIFKTQIPWVIEVTGYVEEYSPYSLNRQRFNFISNRKIQLVTKL